MLAIVVVQLVGFHGATQIRGYLLFLVSPFLHVSRSAFLPARLFTCCCNRKQVNTDVERKRLSLWQDFLLDSFKSKNMCADATLARAYWKCLLPFFDLPPSAVCLWMSRRTSARSLLPTLPSVVHWRLKMLKSF